MRAMLLDATKPAERNPLQLREIETPTPASGQIRVLVNCCGLCHTDLHTVEGDLPLPKLPIVPGHQIVGIVESVGKNAKNFREGDRVGIPWLFSTDGTCKYCREGSENLCENARFTGYHVNGGYAEQVVVGEDFAYKIPANFSDESAAPLLCAGIIGYRSFRLSNAKNGDRVGLYGFGASAHIVLQFALHLGCEVFVFTRSPVHQELAARLGAVWVGDARQQPPKPLDSAIIFAPAGPLVLDALRAVRKAGTIALAGITMSPVPQFDYDLIYHEKILRSVANSTRQDAREFLQLASEIPVQTTVELFDLEDANTALQKLKHSQIEGAGVLRVRGSAHSAK